MLEAAAQLVCQADLVWISPDFQGCYRWKLLGFCLSVFSLLESLGGLDALDVMTLLSDPLDILDFVHTRLYSRWTPLRSIGWTGP
jgi:hypothetical protein